MNENTLFTQMLKNRIDLHSIPFSERSSRLMIFQTDNRFSIRLAERWYKMDNSLTTYRKRDPLIDEWVFTDHDGAPLEPAVTSYPDHLEISTRVGVFTIVFQDPETIQIGLPPGQHGMFFRANLNEVHPDRRGGVMRLVGNIRRNLAYTTNASLLTHTFEPTGNDKQRVRLLLDAEPGDCLLLNITPRLGFNRYAPPLDQVLASARRRWEDWFAAAPPVLDEYKNQYYFAWWIMGAGLIATRFYTTREAMTPSKSFYVGVWQWDAFFHALAYRHVNRRLAQDQLRIVLDHQLPNGMIPDAVHDEGIVTHLNYPVEADVTKPPLIAWAAWKLFEMDGDREFLDEIYEPIVRWNNWWFENNDTDSDGLCEYQHPFSSGLDDSPLWDDGMPVTSPDLNTYLCLQQDSLAKIAREIGENDASQIWEKRAADMAKRMIDKMWDKKAGLFWARLNGQIVPVRTPFNLFPLITSRMPAEINQRIVEQLTDEKQFWCRYPVPSVALDDPKYDANQMWRGPTWVNVNYLLIEGLQKTGFHQIAAELRRRTLDLISLHSDIYEYYHPETGLNPPLAAAIFGWSSAVFIDLAISATRDASSPPEKSG